MEHQVLLVNKIITIFLLSTALLSCSAPVKRATDLNRLLNKDEQQVALLNGLMMVNNQPFTGTLFTLFGKTTDTAEIMNYLNGREEGEWKKFYPSKKIKEKRYFKNGQKTGEYLSWWENGRQQLQYYFAADEYEGTCREWNETGMLNKVMHYKKGHEDGHQQWWYDQGKVKANYIIKDGRRFGLLGTKNCINVSDSIIKN